MSGERDINFLLNLYEREYVKGEIRSKESLKKIRNNSKRKNRHLILDELLKEAEVLRLSPNQVKVIRYLIDDFSDEFKELHRKVSEECIILAFMFYMKKVESPKIRLDSYKIATKYHLTNHVFETIICRVLLKFMKRTPIRPCINYSRDEHDILIRTGRR